MNTLKNAFIILFVFLSLYLLTKVVKAPITIKEAEARETVSNNAYYFAYGEKFKETRIVDLITRKAKEYGVNPRLAVCIARKESQNFATDVLIGARDGDNHLTCKIKNSEHYGEPIESRGLWQWNECAHPNLPDSDAYDIEESTELAMPALRDYPTIWSTYKDCK